MKRIHIIFLLLLGALFALGGGEAVPAATASEWATNPALAADSNAKGAAETVASISAAGWLAWLAGFGGLIVAIGKFVPGIGGVVANVAGPIYDMVVTKNVRDAEAKQAQLAKGFMTVVATLDKLPKDGTIGDLKRKLADRLPSDCRDAVNEWIQEQEANRPPPT
jgi:hypothetical protein